MFFPGLMVLGGAALATGMVPELWPFALSSLLIVPLYGISLIAVVGLVTLLFPDVDDATQRGFRGLMTLLGMVIVTVPTALVLVPLVFLLRINPMLAALPTAALSLGITAAIAMVAGSL